MKGPSPLNRTSIIANVPAQPGACLLVNSKSYDSIFLMRAANLKTALLDHLPENEKSIEIKNFSPDRYLFQAATDVIAAFDLECRWFHILKPACNKTHPTFFPEGRACPICFYDGKENQGTN